MNKLLNFLKLRVKKFRLFYSSTKVNIKNNIVFYNVTMNISLRGRFSLSLATAVLHIYTMLI